MKHFTSSSLDVLVNCAGILVLGSVDSLSSADYDRVMNLNTREGTTNCFTRAPRFT